MTDDTELQRLMRLRRLGRQIAASLPADLDCEQVFIAGAQAYVSKPTLSKAVLRAQLDDALANYHGPVTLCPPAPPPEREELDLEDDEQEYEAASSDVINSKRRRTRPPGGDRPGNLPDNQSRQGRNRAAR
jgi:hypothetical protein